MHFNVEVIETWRESENTSESITTKEKSIKHIVKSMPDIRKFYFKAFRAFKCQTVYYWERQFRPDGRLKLNSESFERQKRKETVKHVHKFNNSKFQGTGI